VYTRVYMYVYVYTHVYMYRCEDTHLYMYRCEGEGGVGGPLIKVVCSTGNVRA
jgi:hypothetical protein